MTTVTSAQPGAVRAPPSLASRRALTAPIWIAIGVAWAVTIAVDAAGKADVLHHDAVEDGRIGRLAAYGLFLVGWQVMVVAMMLPSSLTLIRLFRRAASGQDRPGLALAALLGGYAAVWTLFGAAAFVGDLGLHGLVHRTPWLEDRPWVVAGGALLLAGAFQLSELKDRCLSVCRHPAAYLMPRYRRGWRAALGLGLDHGVFCLGCCWALMLLMFAAGLANVAWMAGLAALMAYEKIGRHGSGAAHLAGAGLLAWGLLVLLQPGWLPGPLAGPS